MNILHISSAKTWRGGEQQIAYLLDGLAAAGVSNHLMAVEGSALAQRISHRLISYRKGFSSNPWVGWRIATYCKKANIDVVHCHDSHAHTFAWMAAALFGLSTPIVVSRRVDFPISPSSYYKYNHKAIKSIICVSDFIRQVVAESVADSGKVAVVHDGVDLKAFDDIVPMDLHAKYNIPRDRRIVGNVAALAGHKDHMTMVRAIKHYVASYSDPVHFVIVGGDDGEKENVQRYLQAHGLASYVTLTGFVRTPKAHLKAFDLFLFTSKMEGLGTSVIDAMVAGVPIVSTQAGGLREIVLDGETALAARVGDAEQIAESVHRVLYDSSLRRALVDGAGTFVLDFSKEKMAQQTLDICSAVSATTSV